MDILLLPDSDKESVFFFFPISSPLFIRSFIRFGIPNAVEVILLLISVYSISSTHSESGVRINGDNLDVSFYTCYSMHLLANLYVNNNVMALCKTSNTLTKMFGDDKWCPRNDIQRRSQSPPSYSRFICNIWKLSMNCVSTLSNANEFWPRWQRMESTALCVHLAWNEGALNDMVFASRWTNYTRFSCMDWASLVMHVVNNIRVLNFEYLANKKKPNRKNRLVIQRTSHCHSNENGYFHSWTLPNYYAI